MPKSVRNPITGRLRRQAPRYTTRNKRDGALYVAKRDLIKNLQAQMVQCCKQLELQVVMASMFMVHHELATTILDPGHEYMISISMTVVVLTTSIMAATAMYTFFADHEQSVAEIPQDEEDENAHQNPVKWTRISDMETDNVAKCNTNFNKSQLHRLSDLFG